MESTEKPICFVVGPIGKEDSDTRRRSDKIFKHVFGPVASQCGFQALRADHISEVGMITTQVLLQVINAPMVVADMTGHNPNVFYELAIRHASGKPYVQIIARGEKIPFDVAGVRTMEDDLADLDDVERVKEEMKSQMSKMSADGKKIESPISNTLDLESLRRSDDPVQRQMADILTEMSSIRTLIQQRLPRRLLVSHAARDSKLVFTDTNSPARDSALTREAYMNLAKPNYIASVLRDAEKNLEDIQVLEEGGDGKS